MYMWHLHVSVTKCYIETIYRPFRTFIRDIDRPSEKSYRIATINPSLKIEVAT